MFYYVSKKNVDILTENICPRCGAINYSGGSFLCCGALKRGSSPKVAVPPLNPCKKSEDHWSLANFRNADILTDFKS